MKDIVFTSNGWSDFSMWSKTDRKLFDRISQLIEETSRTPFKGKGNPEPLKHQFSGCWSRRISGQHRMVYQVTDTEIRILSCRYHYSTE